MIMAIAMTAAQPAALDIDRLIACLCAVESGNNWHLPGGALQWSPSAWKEEAPNQAYEMAKDKPVAIIYAKLRLSKFAVKLTYLGIRPTAYNLSMCWRYGFEGAIHLLTHMDENDYGRRVENLYNDITNK